MNPFIYDFLSYSVDEYCPHNIFISVDQSVTKHIIWFPKETFSLNVQQSIKAPLRCICSPPFSSDPIPLP